MKLPINTAQSATAGHGEGGENYVFLYVTIAVFILFIIIGIAYLLRELLKGYLREFLINDSENNSTVCVDATLKSEVGSPIIPDSLEQEKFQIFPCENNSTVCVDATLKSEVGSPIIPDSLEQEKFQIFPCGLENKSSVCYMNSMIQAVASSNILIKEFEKINKLRKRNSHLFKFVNLLRSINESGNSKEAIYKNTKLLEELIESVGWKKPSQQDAFDLFASLVKEIQDGMKNIGDFEMPMKIKLVHKFNGIDIPDKVQDHLGLSVGLCGNYAKRPGETLVYLINEHFSPTIIDDDPSKTTQMFYYRQPPEVLLIHIQANKWDYERGEMVKPTYYVKYSKEMTLPMVIVPKIGSKKIKPDEIIYELKSVVHHIGTISGGHYVTYREYHGRWYLVNDEQVANVEFDPDIVPYILIYERKENRLRKEDDD